jgi:hypothetical protein
MVPALGWQLSKSLRPMFAVPQLKRSTVKTSVIYTDIETTWPNSKKETTLDSMSGSGNLFRERFELGGLYIE